MILFSSLEIYRIVSQRQIQDPVHDNRGSSTPGSLQLPPTDSNFSSKQNAPCCS